MQPMHPPQPVGQAGPMPPVAPVGYTVPAQRPPLDQPATDLVPETAEENGPASGLLPIRQHTSAAAPAPEHDASVPDAGAETTAADEPAAETEEPAAETEEPAAAEEPATAAEEAAEQAAEVDIDAEAPVEPEPVADTAEPLFITAGDADDLTAVSDLDATAEEIPEGEPVPPPAEPASTVGGRRPGDVVSAPIAVWTAAAAQRFRDEWQVVAAQFVDEPDDALTQARLLVSSAVRQLSETLLAEQAGIDPRQDEARPDTEAMRVAMRRYHALLHRVLAL